MVKGYSGPPAAFIGTHESGGPAVVVLSAESGPLVLTPEQARALADQMRAAADEADNA